MRLQFLACIQMIFFAALAASSLVSVQVTAPFASFTKCGPPTIFNVVFHTVIGHLDNGTPVVFKRNWASETTAAMALARLPEPLMGSTITECANSIAARGHDAFEFSAGTCTAIKLASALCCDVSGSHVYVSERFDGGSGELKNFTDESTGVTKQGFSPIVDISKMLEATSSENEDDLKPATGMAAYKYSDGKIYSFSVDYIDVDNCIGPNACGPFIYYNRDPSQSSSTSPLYLTDYCGGAIPGPIEFGQAILSHRGFGCEYMPAELLNNDCVQCVVEMNFTSNCGCDAAIHFYDYIGGDSCDGLSLILNETTTSETRSKELCDPPRFKFSASNSRHYLFHLSITKPDRLGFVIGHLIED